jgi:hypothetical protein
MERFFDNRYIMSLAPLTKDINAAFCSKNQELFWKQGQIHSKFIKSSIPEKLADAGSVIRIKWCRGILTSAMWRLYHG